MSTDMNLKRICVATDFSEASGPAVWYAVRLAETFGAELHLLHVLQDISLVLGHPDVTMQGDTVEHFLAGHEAAATTRLEELAAFARPRRQAVRQAVRHGVAGQEICRYAERQQIDLLILGTHGHTGLKHLFLGSVAERVVRTAPCPVLTVRHPAARATLPADETETAAEQPADVLAAG